MKIKHSHKDKVKLAKKMQTKEEAAKKGQGHFDSEAWKRRKAARAAKELAKRT